MDIDAVISKWWGRLAVVTISVAFHAWMRKSDFEYVRLFAFVPPFVGGIIYAKWVWEPTK